MPQDGVSLAIKTPFRQKVLRCTSYFQLSSWCSMKQCLLFDILHLRICVYTSASRYLMSIDFVILSAFIPL